MKHLVLVVLAIFILFSCKKEGEPVKQADKSRDGITYIIKTAPFIKATALSTYATQVGANTYFYGFDSHGDSILAEKDTTSIQTSNITTLSTSVSTTSLRSDSVPPVGAPYLKNIIYLDFNGQTVSNTNWNFNGDIVAANSGLTYAQIQTVLRRVKAAYKYQTVYVTTNDSIYNAAAIDRKIRVIITTSWQWYGLAGGVAFMRSMWWGNGAPCWVFSSLYNYNLDYISQACAHEAGHTIALRHQVDFHTDPVTNLYVKDDEYHMGSTNQACIMGYPRVNVSMEWWTGRNSYLQLQYDTRIMEDATLIGPRLPAGYVKVGG